MISCIPKCRSDCESGCVRGHVSGSGLSSSSSQERRTIRSTLRPSAIVKLTAYTHRRPPLFSSCKLGGRVCPGPEVTFVPTVRHGDRRRICRCSHGLLPRARSSDEGTCSHWTGCSHIGLGAASQVAVCDRRSCVSLVAGVIQR